MVNSQAVFFDGISGSGKSTTSQLIYLDLLAKDCDVVWYYEHEHPHPIVSTPEIDGALQNAMPWEQVFGHILERTSAMIEEVKQTDRVLLFESCLYQIVAGYLFRMNLPHREIIDTMLQLEDRLAPLHPHLIYFHQPDVAEALRQICVRRGDGFDQYLLQRFAGTPYGEAHAVHDFDSLAKAYAAFREITDELVQSTKLNVLSIDTAPGDWQTILDKVSSFIGAGTFRGPKAPQRGLQEYEGQYRETQSGHVWNIVAQDGGLIFDDEFRVKLHPYREDVFLIAGVTVELHFETNSDGTMDTIRCDGNVTGDPIIGTVWKKEK